MIIRGYRSRPRWTGVGRLFGAGREPDSSFLLLVIPWETCISHGDGVRECHQGSMRDLSLNVNVGWLLGPSLPVSWHRSLRSISSRYWVIKLSWWKDKGCIVCSSSRLFEALYFCRLTYLVLQKHRIVQTKLFSSKFIIPWISFSLSNSKIIRSFFFGFLKCLEQYMYSSPII